MMKTPTTKSITPQRLADALVAAGVIHPHAIEDREGYDNYQTWDAVIRAAIILSNAFITDDPERIGETFGGTHSSLMTRSVSERHSVDDIVRIIFQRRWREGDGWSQWQTVAGCNLLKYGDTPEEWASMANTYVARGANYEYRIIEQTDRVINFISANVVITDSYRQGDAQTTQDEQR
jgi:hypothetical protein